MNLELTPDAGSGLLWEQPAGRPPYRLGIGRPATAESLQISFPDGVMNRRKEANNLRLQDQEGLREQQSS